MHIGDQDQLRAALKDFAIAVRAYYCHLIEAGFEPHQALSLTLMWQTTMMQKGKESQG